MAQGSLLVVGLAGAGSGLAFRDHANDVRLGLAAGSHLEDGQQAAFGGGLVVGQLVEHHRVGAELGDFIAPEVVGVVAFRHLAGVDGAVFVSIDVNETAAEQRCGDFELHG